MKFSISFKYSNVTFKNKETKETIAYDTKATEGNTFTFDNVDEDVVIGMLKGLKDRKASQLFAYDDLRTNFINVMARNKCKELYDKLDKAEWKIEDIAVSNITIKDVEFTKPTMNAREAITVESRKMKKLNITKEQLNRSRYFKDKYGELEYVSESGKMFKTNKGKVLMFKESASKGFEKFCEELKSKFSDIDGVKIYLMDNEDGSNTITVSIRRFDDARSVWYPEDVKKIGQFIKRKCDRFGWTVDKNVEYRLGITDFYITEIESSNDIVKESTKKFGKKFNESYEDGYDDGSMGDGQWHVFDYGHGFPYTEQYMIMAPTGDTWPATSSGAICDYDGEYLYSTRQEMEDDTFALDVDGKEWTPTELEQPYPRPVQKAIRLVISRLEEEGITVDEP